mgnify:CR=1 FL=1
MLKPAQLYRDEVTKKYVETWYDLKYMWYYTHGCEELKLPDSNYEKHNFVCVNSGDAVTGYFSYSIDWRAKSIYSVGAMSFVDNNVLFMRDILNHFKDMFENHNIQRLEFWAYTDNPVNKTYSKLVSKFGGREVGILRKSNMAMDGKLHDTVIYEILKED